MLYNYNPSSLYYSAKSEQALKIILGDFLSKNIDVFFNHYIQSVSTNFFPKGSN